jgi:hypothetical protein
MRLASGEVLIWVALFLGFGVYGFVTVATSPEPFPLIRAIGAGCLIVTGLLLLLRFKWSPELFAGSFLLLAVWGVYRIAVEGYEARRLLLAIGPFVVLGIWYPSVRRAIRGTAPPNSPGPE